MSTLVRNLTSLSIIALMVFCLSNCKNDEKVASVAEKPMTADDLVGEWTIVEAYKGNQPSKMLEKGLFTFSPTYEFSNNFLGDPSQYPYTFNGRRIKVKNGSRTSYDVIKLTSDTLVMKTKLRNFDFQFITTKVQ